MMECDHHVISEGIYIPKAVEVHSDHGFGHTFGYDRMRPMGPGQVLSDPISIGVLGGDNEV